MPPASAVERPYLMDALKQHVLRQEACSGANATAITAPSKKTGNTTATNGMGGVGTRSSLLVDSMPLTSSVAPQRQDDDCRSTRA